MGNKKVSQEAFVSMSIKMRLHFILMHCCHGNSFGKSRNWIDMKGSKEKRSEKKLENISYNSNVSVWFIFLCYLIIKGNNMTHWNNEAVSGLNLSVMILTYIFWKLSWCPEKLRIMRLKINVCVGGLYMRTILHKRTSVFLLNIQEV